MPSMSEMAYSLEMRDVIQKMVNERIDAERPRYRYARVQSIDRTKRTCGVIYNGETGTVRVNMGSIQPNALNQIVRVEGIGVDKYITDVIGDAYNAGKIGTVDPYYTAGAPKVLWDGDAVMSDDVYGTDGLYQPASGDRVISVNVPGKGIIIIPVRTRGQFEYSPRWHTVPMQDGWVNYGEGYQDFGFTKTSSGIVHLRGLIKGGSELPDRLMATLPDGFRPTSRGMFPIQGANGALGFRGNVGIKENGRIETRSVKTAFTSLDGICYPAADAAPESAWITPTLTSPWGNYRDLVPADTGLWTRAGYWRDADGFVHERGLVRRSDTTNTTSPIYGKPAGYRAPTNQSLHRPASAQDLGAYVQVLNNGVTQYAGGVGTAYVSLDSMPYANETYAGWQALPLTNGWVNYGGAWSTPGYTMTPGRHVHLKGLIQAGNAGAIAGPLPVSMRPAKRLLMPATSNGAHARVDITPDGMIQTGEGYSGVWLSLDSINFIAEQ